METNAFGQVGTTTKPQGPSQSRPKITGAVHPAPSRRLQSESAMTPQGRAGIAEAGPAQVFDLRETRRMHREEPHKLLQVGVTPTPATTQFALVRVQNGRWMNAAQTSCLCIHRPAFSSIDSAAARRSSGNRQATGESADIEDVQGQIRPVPLKKVRQLTGANPVCASVGDLFSAVPRQPGVSGDDPGSSPGPGAAFLFLLAQRQGRRAGACRTIPLRLPSLVGPQFSNRVRASVFSPRAGALFLVAGPHPTLRRRS